MSLSLRLPVSVSQFTVSGPRGLVGLSVRGRVSMTRVMMSSCRTGSDIVPARTPPLPVTRCHLATVALEMMSRSRTVVNSPIVPVRRSTNLIETLCLYMKPDHCSDWLSLQWTAGGGRGLHRGRALSTVGRGSSCQSGNVITPPLNMVAGSVTDRAHRAAPVLRTPVLVTHTDTHTHTHTHTHTDQCCTTEFSTSLHAASVSVCLSVSASRRVLVRLVQLE